MFERGIEANPEKISTIMNMELVRKLKGAQKLIGCLAALSRFISHLGEHGMPLYKLLKNSEQFEWSEEGTPNHTDGSPDQ